MLVIDRLKGNWKVKSLEKVKNSYRLESENKNYAIKIIKYDFEHFYFILSAIKHLQRRGFNNIPKILKNNQGQDYIKLENCGRGSKCGIHRFCVGAS